MPRSGVNNRNASPPLCAITVSCPANRRAEASTRRISRVVLTDPDGQHCPPPRSSCQCSRSGPMDSPDQSRRSRSLASSVIAHEPGADVRSVSCSSTVPPGRAVRRTLRTAREGVAECPVPAPGGPEHRRVTQRRDRAVRGRREDAVRRPVPPHRLADDHAEQVPGAGEVVSQLRPADARRRCAPTRGRQARDLGRGSPASGPGAAPRVRRAGRTSALPAVPVEQVEEQRRGAGSGPSSYVRPGAALARHRPAEPPGSGDQAWLPQQLHQRLG